MKKFIIILMALTSFSTFAKQDFTVEQKVLSIQNIGSMANPKAQVFLELKTQIETRLKKVTESWIVLLKADGTFEEITQPSSKISTDYKIANKFNFGSEKKPIEATVFELNVQYETNLESFQNSSSILVKDNGDVQILKQ